MAQDTTNIFDLSIISVNVDELFDKVKEMKDAGEKIVKLRICEPMPDIDLGKHIDFNAGSTYYEEIEEATPEEIETALWDDESEDEAPEGYEITAEIDIAIE